MFNGLVENSPDNRPVPELAEKFEPKPGAAEWIFTLRKGIQFHNGKEFDADDAVYSLNLHRGDTKSGAAGPMKVDHRTSRSSTNTRFRFRSPPAMPISRPS